MGWRTRCLSGGVLEEILTSETDSGSRVVLGVFMSTFGLVRGAGVWRRSLGGFALVGAALLASCGGGSQSVPFEAQRVLAFGDETSVITASGAKYTVNALQTGNVTLDCASNPIWVQTVASAFGLVFPQCNPTNVASPRSRILATPGAKVADLQAQVNAHLANDSFGERICDDAGRPDDFWHLRAYRPSHCPASAAAEAAGAALAVQFIGCRRGRPGAARKVLDWARLPRPG